jgi:hypothetical protein
VTEANRDEFIDFCRAFSLVVVVLWHWVFTIVLWNDDGPVTTNPIGFTNGFWILTWLFQVMPVFFFVGGFAHMKVWDSYERRGEGYRQFLSSRFRRLAVPGIALAATWLALGSLAAWVLHAPWLRRVSILVISPLWFLGIYMFLVVLAPAAIWAHRRWGPIVPVLLAGAVMLVDVARFAHKVEWVALLNLALVWGLCHQLGFFYETLVKAPRQATDTIMIGGLLGMIALVLTKIYPPSMVGFFGERISNMTPPTLCIVALCLFQVGVLMRLRPWITSRLRHPRWEKLTETVNRFALPLYLFHSTGFAIALAVVIALGYRPADTPTLDWWLQRPIWLILPLAFTWPVILVFGKRWIAPAPPPAEATVSSAPTVGPKDS